jgi:hypothetical protein
MGRQTQKQNKINELCKKTVWFEGLGVLNGRVLALHTQGFRFNP